MAGRIERSPLKKEVQSPQNTPPFKNSTQLHHQICSSDACWFTLAKIEQEPIPLLLDTGANTNVLSLDVYENIIKGKVGLEQSELKLFRANGEPIGVKGRVACATTIGGEKYEVDYVVADLPEVPGILGMEFLSANQCSIELAKGVMRCKGKEIELVKIPQGDAIRVTEVKLPPQQVIKIDVGITGEGKGWVSYGALLDNLGVMAQDGELVSGESATSVNVINVGSGEINLLSGMVIGRIERVESDPSSEITSGNSVDAEDSLITYSL